MADALASVESPRAPEAIVVYRHSADGASLASPAALHSQTSSTILDRRLRQPSRARQALRRTRSNPALTGPMERLPLERFLNFCLLSHQTPVDFERRMIYTSTRASPRVSIKSGQAQSKHMNPSPQPPVLPDERAKGTRSARRLTPSPKAWVVRGAALLATLLLAGGAAGAGAEMVRLKAGAWAVEFRADGSVQSFRYRGQPAVSMANRPAVSLVLGNRELRPDRTGPVEGVRGGIRCRFIAATEPRLDLAMTYQNSHCNPGSWSYGIFPNYRNALWSCCWWPVSKWDWIEFGVRAYQAPVAISNGWGDNLGFGELSPEQRQRVLDLFHWRKHHPIRLRSLPTLPAWKPAR